MKKIEPPKLPPETDTHYFRAEPVYHHYRTVTVIDRCECCDHKIGSHKEKRGVRIVSYKIKKYKKDAFYYMAKLVEKQMLASLDFFSGNYDKPGKGSVLKIPKLSELKP